MKLLLAGGMLCAAMAFCGIGDRIRSISGTSNQAPANSANSARPGNSSAPKTSQPDAEKATLSDQQQSISDSAIDTPWADQGITWRLPPGWKTNDMKKSNAMFSSADGAFLLPTISVLGDDFPSDVSLKATYDSALQQMKNSRYEGVRYLDIDGVKGVEWTETMPESPDGPRRHQWIAFRNYLGQNQQLNIMLSTKGTNFNKHRDEFAAILYTMKIDK